MIANVIVETASDGYYSCYVEEEFKDFALFGYGNSAEEAKADMLASYKEIADIKKKEGKQIPDLEFVYHYDMQSFFNYFNFLNVSKVAERAGINPSLMRKYTSGVAKARQKQYEKLSAAVKQFSNELQAASF